MLQRNWGTEFCSLEFVTNIDKVMDEFEEYLRDCEIKTMSPYKLQFILSKVEHKKLANFAKYGANIKAKIDRNYKARILENGDIVLNREHPIKDQHAIIVSGQNIKIVASELTEETIRTPVRVAREIALREAQNSGAIVSHSACVVLNGFAYVILGDKGAGKTTTMWSQLINGASYLSNDRTLIHISSNKLMATSWPLGIRLGRGLVKNQTVLNPETFNFKRNNGANTKKSNMPFKWGERLKYEISPKEIENLFQRPLVSSAPIAGFILASLEDKAENLDIVSANVSDVEIAFRRSILDPCDEDFLQGWLSIRNISDTSVLSNIEKITSIARNFKSIKLLGTPKLDDMKALLNFTLPN